MGEYKTDEAGNVLFDSEGNPIPEIGSELPPEPTLKIDEEEVPLSEVKKWREFKGKDEEITKKEKEIADREEVIRRREQETITQRETATPFGFKPKTEEELKQMLDDGDWKGYHDYMRSEQMIRERVNATREGIRLVNDQIERAGYKEKKKEIWAILEKNPALLSTDDPVGMAYAKLLKDGLPDHDKEIADKVKKEIEERKKVIGTTEYIVGEGEAGKKKVALTAEERRVAEKMGMTPEEYAKNKESRLIK